MPVGRFWKVTRLSLLLALIGAQQAHAALFDDEEARRLIKDLSIQTNERVDTLAKAQMELLNQITALREENAKLRGSLETLNFELRMLNSNPERHNAENGRYRIRTCDSRRVRPVLYH